MKTSDGQPAGTGPFKIVKWEAGKSATLAAHDAYWGARPYLDGVNGLKAARKLIPVLDPLADLGDRRRLIAARLVVGDDVEGRNTALEIGHGTHAASVRASTDSLATLATVRSALVFGGVVATGASTGSPTSVPLTVSFISFAFLSVPLG